MKPETLLINISRDYFRRKNVFRYRMKKIENMSDADVVNSCHCYCAENDQIDEFEQYRTEVESQYRYCSYLQEFIEDGLCYDIQMITNGYIKSSALPNMEFDFEKAKSHCMKCKYEMNLL